MGKVRLSAAVIVALCLAAPAVLARNRQLTFEERVRAQEAIERVYYAHQIGATKPFEEAVPRELLESKVRTTLQESVALERYWDLPVTSAALRRELQRIARGSRFPERLQEIYGALDNDAILIQECFVRPLLVDRSARSAFASDPGIHADAARRAEALHEELVAGEIDYRVDRPGRFVSEIVDVEHTERPEPSPGLPPDSPARLELSAGQYDHLRGRVPDRVGQIGRVIEEEDAFVVPVLLEEDGRQSRIAWYSAPKITWDAWWTSVREELDPRDARTVAEDRTDLQAPGSASTIRPYGKVSYIGNCVPGDQWDPTTTAGAPVPRGIHTAIWTGNVMIVWGGNAGTGMTNTGGKYDPLTDTWAPTSTANAPPGAGDGIAVWTGNRMVVWGGTVVSNGTASTNTNAGGRYDPIADSWAPTSLVYAPAPRRSHTGVWTGNVLIVWGGYDDATKNRFNDGGKYDPDADTWTPISASGAPLPRFYHRAVWTGTLMIVWGGLGSTTFNTGGRYDPDTDTWTPTSTTGAPAGRYWHSAVWTGNRMVVWGGGYSGYNTGGRYDPVSDTWSPTSTLDAAPASTKHTAIWSGREMIVWGGTRSGTQGLNTGGRYDPVSDTWTPVPIAGAPTARLYHTAVWTGGLMAVWGGVDTAVTDTGGLYRPYPLAGDDDHDGYTVACGDCDDANPLVYPGAMQVCGDNTNNDCESPSWPALTGTNEYDDDLDGITECLGDCDDTMASVYPGAPQLCGDQVNNDCTHPSWPGLAGTNEYSDDHDAFSECQGDCDDTMATVYPGAPQICDGPNNDCNSPGWPSLAGTNDGDDDGDHFSECQGDCDDGNPSINPAASEVCNDVDDNCNGVIDEDLSGLDSDNDGIRNACDNCVFAFNPGQGDSDHDTIGNSCDNCITTPNVLQEDRDSDLRGDACDNCPTEYNTLQDDTDLDTVGDVCDNCIFDPNPEQADRDYDFEGDVCDLDDGYIMMSMTSPDTLGYQQEAGFYWFNVYRGSMRVLMDTGLYTQDPTRIDNAHQFCYESGGWVFDTHQPGVGEIYFYLATGFDGAGETSLGTDSSGGVRPNDNPCP